ncbi:hypothetical protein [Reyranella sp.]|uniref:hypothetical protein n=1 Tax=Reyranella sp. TaxID=1929291 RepID=UPI003BAA5365
MSTDWPNRSDRELWRSLVTAPAVAPSAVPDLDFAAWLDGRLSGTEAARVEAAVAADPELRRAALDLADVLGKPLPAAPARLEVRARALVGFAAERVGGRGGLFGWLFSTDRRFALQRAAAFTAAVVVAISGFMLGGGLGTSLAKERYASTAAQTSTDTTSEFTEFMSLDGY